MTPFDELLLCKRPRIAVVVTDQENNADLCQENIDLLEVRVDLFRNLEMGYLRQHLCHRRKIKKPLLLTVRNDPQEGALPNNRISDTLKAEIFQAMITEVEAIDIEQSFSLYPEMVRLAKDHHKGVIVSAHYLRETPSEEKLESIVAKAKKYDAIVKIAAQANCWDDVARMAGLTIRHRHQRLITMSLGPLGRISRIAFPALGSLLSYSYVAQPAAAGQVPFHKLQEHMRFYYSS